jgi:hypothetical protein
VAGVKLIVGFAAGIGLATDVNAPVGLAIGIGTVGVVGVVGVVAIGVVGVVVFICVNGLVVAGVVIGAVTGLVTVDKGDVGLVVVVIGLTVVVGVVTGVSVPIGLATTVGVTGFVVTAAVGLVVGLTVVDVLVVELTTGVTGFVTTGVGVGVNADLTACPTVPTVEAPIAFSKFVGPIAAVGKGVLGSAFVVGNNS